MPTTVSALLYLQISAYTTTAGEIDSGKKSDDSESDSKSVAMDEGDEFDFTVLQEGSTVVQEALDGQKTTHVFFKLNQATEA